MEGIVLDNNLLFWQIYKIEFLLQNTQNSFNSLTGVKHIEAIFEILNKRRFYL